MRLDAPPWLYFWQGVDPILYRPCLGQAMEKGFLLSLDYVVCTVSTRSTHTNLPGIGEGRWVCSLQYGGMFLSLGLILIYLSIYL